MYNKITQYILPIRFKILQIKDNRISDYTGILPEKALKASKQNQKKHNILSWWFCDFEVKNDNSFIIFVLILFYIAAIVEWREAYSHLLFERDSEKFLNKFVFGLTFKFALSYTLILNFAK